MRDSDFIRVVCAPMRIVLVVPPYFDVPPTGYGGVEAVSWPDGEEWDAPAPDAAPEAPADAPVLAVETAGASQVPAIQPATSPMTRPTTAPTIPARSPI